jgi:hypothetical protein
MEKSMPNAALAARSAAPVALHSLDSRRLLATLPEWTSSPAIVRVV